MNFLLSPDPLITLVVLGIFSTAVSVWFVCSLPDEEDNDNDPQHPLHV